MIFNCHNYFGWSSSSSASGCSSFVDNNHEIITKLRYILYTITWLNLRSLNWYT